MSLRYARVLAGAAALASTLTVAAPTIADEVADFYSKKRLTVLIGFGVGGGVDTFGRLMARHIGDNLPGKPTVVVQNMPGGGGFKSTNYLYNAAPQDGTYITVMLPSNAVEPLMGNPGAKWDTFKLQWLGNLTQDYVSCIASGKSGVKSIAEASSRQIIFGATGPSALTAQQPYVFRNLLGYQAKVITGYNGTKAVWLAMEKGEVDAVCAFWASLAMGPQKQNMDSGAFVPIVQMGNTKHPVYGNAPSIYDLAKNDADRQVMQFIFGLTQITRPFAAPPGVPAERVAALRKAFWDAANSDGLKADAKKQKLIVDPMDAAATEKAFRDVLSMPRDIIDRAKVLIRRPKS
jgi:tripartite-type tricarboxylate transporter receptor subunit TctC